MGKKANRAAEAIRRQERRATRRWAWALVGAAAVAFLALLTADSWWPVRSAHSLSASQPEQVTRGERVYREQCEICHGLRGRGENPATPQGGMKPGGGYISPALDGTGHMHHHSPDVLLGYLKDGSPAQDSPMRSFKDRISEDDMRAVLAYLWSLWPPTIQSAYERSRPSH